MIILVFVLLYAVLWALYFYSLILFNQCVLICFKLLESWGYRKVNEHQFIDERGDTKTHQEIIKLLLGEWIMLNLLRNRLLTQKEMILTTGQQCKVKWSNGHQVALSNMKHAVTVNSDQSAVFRQIQIIDLLSTKLLIKNHVVYQKHSIIW